MTPDRWRVAGGGCPTDLGWDGYFAGKSIRSGTTPLQKFSVTCFELRFVLRLLQQLSMPLLTCCARDGWSGRRLAKARNPVAKSRKSTRIIYLLCSEIRNHSHDVQLRGIVFANPMMYLQ